MLAEELHHQKEIRSESEVKYRDLYEMALVIYLTLDKEGVITDCSAEFHTTLGYEKKDILNKPLVDFYSEDYANDFIVADWPATLRGERVNKLERQLVKKDGNTLDVLLDANPIFDDKNQVIGCRAIFANITGQKKMEKNLRESQQTLLQRTNELDRHNSLISAFAQIGTVIEAYLLPADVIQSLTNELLKIGIHSAVSQVDTKEGALNYQFMPLGQKTTGKIERIINKNLSQFKIKAENYPGWEDVVEKRTPFYIGDIPNALHTVFPNLPQGLIGKLMTVLKISPVSKSFSFPLIINNKVWGILDLWDETINQADENAYTVLANQVSVAVKNALLFGNLEKSEKEYRRLVETMAEGLALVNEFGKISYVNNQFCQLTGYSEKELLRQSLARFLDAVNKKIFLNQFSKREKGKINRFEIRVSSKNKGMVDLSISTRPAIENGKFKGILAVVTDITAGKRLDTDLRESEEKFSTVFRHSNDAIILHHTDGTIIDVNQMALTLFGYSREEFFAMKIKDLHPKAVYPIAYENSKRFLEAGKLEIEIEFQKSDGRIFPAELSANTIELRGKRIIQGIIRDIGYRKELERELMQSEKLASVGHLAAGVAHRLRNPLAVVLSATRMLEEMDELNTKTRKTISAISRNSKRAVDVVSDLLNFTTPKELSFQLLKVDATIRKSIRMVEADLARHRIKLKTKFAGSKVTAYYDHEAFMEVLINIFRNSIDACGTGGNIGIKVSNADEFVLVEITDNGQGISQADLARIYDPFFTTKAHGSGIGLAEAHRIMTAHWGSINVESEPGGGTKVILKLPTEKREVAKAIV